MNYVVNFWGSKCFPLKQNTNILQIFSQHFLSILLDILRVVNARRRLIFDCNLGISLNIRATSCFKIKFTVVYFESHRMCGRRCFSQSCRCCCCLRSVQSEQLSH